MNITAPVKTHIPTLIHNWQDIIYTHAKAKVHARDIGVNLNDVMRCNGIIMQTWLAQYLPIGEIHESPRATPMNWHWTLPLLIAYCVVVIQPDVGH